MIDIDMLERWKRAKVIAVTNPNTDREVCVALQEALIEAKALRKENLALLNVQDLNDKMVDYINLSLASHYVTSELTEALADITEMAERFKLNVDINYD